MSQEHLSCVLVVLEVTTIIKKWYNKEVAAIVVKQSLYYILVYVITIETVLYFWGKVKCIQICIARQLNVEIFIT